MQTSYTYDPFGNPTVSGASSGNRLEYTGASRRRHRPEDVTARGRDRAADPAGRNC